MAKDVSAFKMCLLTVFIIIFGIFVDIVSIRNLYSNLRTRQENHAVSHVQIFCLEHGPAWSRITMIQNHAGLNSPNC